MNKTAIKNFAIWARNKLISDISYRAGLMGINEKGIADALPQSTGDTEFYDIGAAKPYSITGDAIRQRKKLVGAIRKKESNTDYKTAYQYIIEEVAYTWFNRLIAVRFMEVNDYLPSHIRVLSSESGRLEPDLVATPFDAELPFTPAEEAELVQLRQDNKIDEAFRILFVKQCNALNEILPFLFEKTKDYTELLINLSVIDQDGVVYHLIHDIPEDDFNIEHGGQVEIIGWLYQYYNTEPKAAAFAKNGKITKEEIPAVTQLFTPDWIVRYMVENSLGRIFINGQLGSSGQREVASGQLTVDSEKWSELEKDRIKKEKELAEKMGWKYYLPEAEQEPTVRKELDKLVTDYSLLITDPTRLKLIDPCMGSGHILVYAFDVLMQIYTSVGYSEREAARSILENNIYGLDIDDRAYQLAYFAVMMKARQYNRRILNGETTCHVYSIQESNTINRNHLKYFGATLSDLEKNLAKMQIEGLLDTMTDAKEYGSILNVESYDWDLLRRFVADLDLAGQICMDSFGIEDTIEQLRQLIDIGETMAQKYWVTVTNPPYAGTSNLSAKVNNFVKKHYPDSKADLFAVFIERCGEMLKKNGFQAMITQHAWMFLSSFEKLRRKLQYVDIVNMAHLGARAFEEISGEVVQTTSFVIRRGHLCGYCGCYSRLVYENSQQKKEKVFLLGKNQIIGCQDKYFNIPGKPVAYWISKKMAEVFERAINLRQLGRVTLGMRTGDNDRFLRLWQEVQDTFSYYSALSAQDAKESHAKWFPYNKGGEYRKWYGNTEYVVNWKDDGTEIKENTRRVYPQLGNNLSWKITSEDKYFTKGIAWSRISSTNFGVRICGTNLIFDTAAPMFFPNNEYEEWLDYIAAFMCSKIAGEILRILNPTLTFQVGDVGNLPVILESKCKNNIDILSQECFKIAKCEWNSFETSWDFKRHPLLSVIPHHAALFDDIDNIDLAECYACWENECTERFNQLKTNEEELNRIFIDIYGLQDELTPEVEDKDVTVRKADLQRDIKSLISYAVGCMFGRYSLNEEGLIYAGGEWDDSRYATFKPYKGNIIPITDEEYLDDDIVSRFCTWLKTAFGAKSLETNLDFIAKALGNKGNTSRKVIRNYFLSDFFKDHCQTYSVTGSGKRPIYWLFDSGKQNGFKALIYLHRYNQDTIGSLRVDYLHKLQRIYESEINRMQDMIDHTSNAREAAESAKRKEKLAKQLKECREYDEKIGHLAMSRIELDLDDGVKVNYRKIQTAYDGKFYEVLADSKNIMVKEK